MDWEKYLNAERLRPTTRTKSTDNRNEFESDFGRVIFSPAIRRMHDKTQVQPLTTNDNIHSRLTHSLEVMAIGYSLGVRLCDNKNFLKKSHLLHKQVEREIPIILKNACLVHDIGNPPFGHFGESVIQIYFKQLFKNKVPVFQLTENEKRDFEEFDGNAQGFRVLTKLQYLNDLYGLNLTYASLAAYLKYPNLDHNKETNLIAHHKKGVFESERMYLNKIAEACGLYMLYNDEEIIMRHPLAFLVEAADSICYLTMDIEDGFNKGWYSFEYVYNQLKSIPGLRTLKMSKKADTNDVSKMVKLRIKLIQELVNLAISNFSTNLIDICNGSYNKELIYDDECGLAKKLQDFCIKNIFPKREVQSLELTGHAVISGLLDYYIEFLFNKGEKQVDKKRDNDYQKRAKGLISKSIIDVAMLESNLPLNSPICLLNDYYKLRIIVDFISGMTDQYALNHYQKLNGQKII